MRVDSQVHLWAANSPMRPWPPDSLHLAHSSTPPSVGDTLAVLDSAGVRRAVLVPPSWEGDRNDVVLAAAIRHPDRFAVMGRVPLGNAAAARAMPAWRRRGMAGVRITLHREPWRTVFRARGFPWFWAAAEAAALPVMVYAPRLLVPLADVARRHPALRLIVDHLALPLGLAGAEAFAGLDELLALSRFPNVAVKASALPCHSREPYPFHDVHEPLRRVVDGFGPERVFWGSDWTRLPCTYEENVRLFTEALDFLSGRELDQVMGEALLKWLDWPVDGAEEEAGRS